MEPQTAEHYRKYAALLRTSSAVGFYKETDGLGFVILSIRSCTVLWSPVHVCAYVLQLKEMNHLRCTLLPITWCNWLMGHFQDRPWLLLGR